MTVIATHLAQKTCYRCERPPLTFDAQERALCARHATIFLVAGRVDLSQPRDTSEDCDTP